MSNIPITVCGTVATAPQSRTLPTGRPCASFRLAVNHWRWDKATNEYVSDTTSWFGIDCYGSLANNVGSSVTVGMSVVIQGHLRIREWESQERSGITPTIIADHLGPDLRFGTANYVKAQAPQAARQSGSAESATAPASAWAGLGDAGAAATAGGNGSAMGAAGGGQQVRGGQAAGGELGGDFRGDSSARDSDDAADDSVPGPEVDDDADTAEAGAGGYGGEGTGDRWQASTGGGDDERGPDDGGDDDADSDARRSDDIAGATAAAAAPF